MRRVPFLVLLLVAGSASAQLNGNYNIVLEENGNSLVTLVINGVGTINIPLPLDVRSPAVRDALYVRASNGVEVSIDADGQSTIVYKTALLTSREGGRWRYMMELPPLESATVVVYVPETAVIAETSPPAAISHVGESKSMIWNLKPVNDSAIVAEYSFSGSAGHMTEEGGGRGLDLKYVLAVVLAPLAATAVIIYLVRRRQRGEGLVLSGGKQNVLKTLTGNEMKIVSLLLQNMGGMQRNKLEKTSGIPKSSLASSLYNLEQRKIIRVDKSYAVHYVELTEWFKSL
ncbi:MAG: hypothetical protein GF416_04480 [Candidatus Altiarchaeales archaeon]|nr:hypothetical protein [Candidatus Altiarchaeales archaeon]MBD3416376.1 hypothetical protein [Candidatus Altiarchaeales archaeon]